MIRGETGEILNQKLTPLLEQIVHGYDLPGLAIGIVQENEIVYARAFGYSNAESGEPLNLHTLFHVASNSKPFTATAVMQLAERGKIDLDSAVVRYLPYFKLRNGPYGKITVKQMLTHHSGMPDIGEYKWQDPVYHEFALENYVRSIAKQEMVSEPGERFFYSSMAFECLGDLVAKVSGMPFESYIEKRILRPTGMRASTFRKTEDLPDHWAEPHARILSNVVWDHYPYSRAHGPSSTLHSNVLEMCSWSMINLNRGNLANRRILEEASFDQLWEPWFPTIIEDHMGLSWFIGKYRDYQTIGHSGADTGFSSFLVMIPEKSLAVVMLCNTDPAPWKIIRSAILDILLGFEPQINQIPATIPVFQELKAHGVDSAVALWDSLRIHQSDKYDFGIQQFIILRNAMRMDRTEEAELLSQLCVRVVPEETIELISREAEWFRTFHHPNNAASAILEVFAKDNAPNSND